MIFYYNYIIGFCSLKKIRTNFKINNDNSRGNVNNLIILNLENINNK